MAEDENTAESEDLMDGDEEVVPDLTYEDDAINLVPVFLDHPDGEDIVKGIGDRVKEDFDADWGANKPYRESCAEIWSMFAGELEEKTFPYEDCANGNVPIVLENITRLQSRVYAEIFSDRQGVFGVVPVGPDDERVAELLSHHGNWQIREKIPDFFRQQLRGLLSFYLYGDVTSHSSWDPFRQENRHDILTCDEFVAPYTHVSTMPDYSDVPHKTRIRRMQRHEIEAYRGVWHDIDFTLDREPQFDDEPDDPLGKAGREVDQVELPDNSTAAPYKILEYEGHLELPNQTKPRYCRVIYDPIKQHVLLLEIREEASWEERSRYEMEIQEMEAYQRGMEIHDAGVEAYRASEAQITNSDMLPEQKAGILADMRAEPMPPPPVEPRWMENPHDPFEKPRSMRMVPIHMFAHGVCIENLTGNMGLGIGRIEADFNRAANTMLNQAIDAATLSNCGGYIADSSVNFPDGFKVGPGKISLVEGVEPGELQNALIPIKTPPANPQLLEGVDRMYRYGQSAMQSPAVLSGEAGKSGETAKGLTSRIEQATKQTSVSANIYGGFVTQIFKNNAHLNSIFLPENEVFMVNNHMGSYEELRVGREMYQRNFKVELLSRLKFTTTEAKKAEAGEMLGMVSTHPNLIQNQAVQYSALVEWFKANGHEEMIPKLGSPPPSPEQFLPPPPPPEEPPAGAKG